MPNAPHHPRIALPPALAARVDALRAVAPTGRPSRQAVVEAALATGLGVLEAPLATMGEHHAREAFAALVADLEALAGALGGAYWEALRLARRRAGEAVRGREDAGWASGAPTGQRGPVATAQGAPPFQPPPNDPRWALDGVGKPYARESHVVGAVAPNGKRVEVAVAAGDTVAIVRRSIEAVG